MADGTEDRRQKTEGGGGPIRIERLSEVETQRDMEWMRNLLMRELELTEDEALLAQTIAVGTSGCNSVSLVFIFMHNFMIAGFGIAAARIGIHLGPSGGPEELIRKWLLMQRKSIEYFKLMGRIPAGAKDHPSD